MASRWAIPAAGAALLLALLVVATGFPTPRAAVHPGQGDRASLNGDPTVGRATTVTAPFAGDPSARGSVAPATGGPSCTALSERFGALYDGPAPPPGVSPALFGGCPIGRDVAGLGLVSSAPASGSRIQLTIGLPTGGGAAGALQAFGVGLWLSGVPCSVGGASLLTIDLLPPFSGPNGSSGANWSLWAPVWDLVAPGSCDPKCQNASALFSLEGTGRRFCEDDVVLQGPGARGATSGAFAPGDRLNVSLVGAVGAGPGLSMWVNDTNNAGRSLSWSLGGSASVSGLPLRPLLSTSTLPNGPGAWGSGPSVSLLAFHCPSGPGPSPCRSYDGPLVNATPLPELLRAVSWNSTQSAYADPYPRLAPFSTSGACSSAPGVAPCPDFSTFGGTGTYPSWGLSAASGQAFVTYGGSAPFSVSPLGGASQFNATGGAGPAFAPMAVTAMAASGGAAYLNVSARVSAMAGLRYVNLTGYDCFASSTPSTLTTAMTESPGSTNGSDDGNFTGSFPVSFASHGRAYFAVTLAGPGGSSLGPVWASAPRSGGGPACSFPDPPKPYFGPSNVSSVPGGYRIDFAENSSAATNFTLRLVPFGGGPTILRAFGDVRTATVLVGPGGTAYNLTLQASDAAGRSSPPSASVIAPATGALLSATLSAENVTSYWTGATVGWLNATIHGGVSPFTYRIDFGDGNLFLATLPGPFENLTHRYGSYSGVALLRCQVTDASGAVALSTPLGLSVIGGALGVNQTQGAGASDVRFSWSPPISPGGAVRSYTLFYATSPGAAPFVTEGWPNNDSARGTYLWNTTLTSLDLPNLAVGITVFGVVVAWVGGVPGITPDGWFAWPNATTAELNASAISVTPTGGPAPLNVSFSTFVLSGTNGSLTQAVYSIFPDVLGGGLNATVAGNDTLWWLNATAVIPASGSFTVLLHVADAYGDAAIPITTLFVAPTVAPTVTAQVTSGLPWVGEPVFFTAGASGGTGAYRFNWSFGDGAEGLGPQPNHTYRDGGNFTVVLRTLDTGDGVEAVTLLNLSVRALPTVSIRVSAADETGTSFDFSAVAAGGVSPYTISWAFGDGATANGPSVSHHYLAAGDFRVNVSLTDSARRSAAAEVNVVVPGAAAGSPTGGTVSGVLVGALILLAVVAAIGVIGTAYYYSRSRSEPPEPPRPPRGGDEEGPEELADRPVRALPPPDPPDPS